MRSISILSIMLAVSLLATACRQHDKSSPPATKPVVSTSLSTMPIAEPTLPQPAIQPTATQRPSPLLQQTVYTPTATIETTLATYRGKSIYPDSPLFELTYDEVIWEMDQSDLDNEPQLIMRETPSCYLYLREGPREYWNIGPIQLAEQMWMLRLHLPDYLIYGIEIGWATVVDAFIFGLHLPEEYREGQHSECQKVAEAVLATFRVVKESK